MNPSLDTLEVVSPSARLLSPGRKTIRARVNDELALEPSAHFHLDPTSPVRAAMVRLAIDPALPGFGDRLPRGGDVDALCDGIYVDVHTRHAATAPRFTDRAAPHQQHAQRRTNMPTRKPLHLLFLFICLALLAGGCRSVSVPPAVTGRAIYMLNVTLPADAVVKFQLVRMTVSGEVLEIVGEQLVPNVRRAPILFHLPYTPSEIRSRDYYGVTCEVRTGERVIFRTARPFPVITQGASKQVEVLLEQVR